MQCKTSSRLHTILAEPLDKRVEQRDEFFEVAVSGLERIRGKLTKWVSEKVFFGVEVEKVEVERTVSDLEEKTFEHLLNNLDDTYQHSDYSLRDNESLFSYTLKVGRKHNMWRDARKRVTYQEVEVANLGEKKDILIFALPISESPDASSKEEPSLPNYITEDVTPPVSAEDVGAFCQFEKLKGKQKVAFLLHHYMPIRPTVNEFLRLAKWAELPRSLALEYASRLELVLKIRKDGNAAIRMPEIATILGDTEKKIRLMLKEALYLMELEYS